MNEEEGEKIVQTMGKLKESNHRLSVYFYSKHLQLFL